MAYLEKVDAAGYKESLERWSKSQSLGTYAMQVCSCEDVEFLRSEFRKASGMKREILRMRLDGFCAGDIRDFYGERTNV